MAERKLNFNAPLLSVRRFAKPSANSERENKKTVKSSPPRKKYTRDPPFEPTFNLEQVTEPVAVPFNWEQIPGKAKDDKEAEAQPREEAFVTPRMPPGKVLVPRKQQQELDHYPHKPDFRPQTKAFSFSSSIVESKYSKEGTTDDRKGLEVEDEDDDAYSDALETLSSKESASLNCSASGLSGSESAGLGKPSGTFSTDPQTRDFMMKRFLPAAKAMALEPPRYAAKKQALVVQEQPREVKRVIGMDKRVLNDERGPNIVPKYGDYKEEEEESEDDSDDYDSTRSISARGCGFFPRLCFRNSLSILGPIPGLKVRTPTPPRKTSNNHSEIKPAKKQTWDSTHKAKTNCKFRSAELHVVEKKLVSESKRLAYSGDLQRGRSSPSTHSRAASISPYRNRPSQSPFRRAAFLGVPKEENVKVPNIKPNYLYNKATNKFEDISANHRNKLGSLSMSPAVEKTLYVDSVNNAHDHESSYSNSGFLDTKEQLKSGSEDFEHLLVSRRVVEEEASLESIFQDIMCLNSVSKQPSLLGDSELGLAQEFSELVTKGNLRKESDQIVKEDLGNIESSLVPSPLPPPLPKSPSESWLWRTAPSISLRNSFSRSKNTSAKAHAKMLKSNTSLTNTKWETIVKSSHLSHDHARYSEELVAHISQKSKKY
ncbi:uncharacterized protein LOC133801678 [Humulus lupulus]|uniref:uncharacterized protein LOC133801678 n=1 Tax=Humulus lupulus TaxID=3486 RepID=UPI002B403B72|nr:uncharacterized protein LOC133801678 [Humulus lupulus]XP_062095912.1 uncharacterized protein LOC133801678 [Humulus lupulus]XP_062095913.1 uncharacterized protein LOC133801678 [Humulus lupulus]